MDIKIGKGFGYTDDSGKKCMIRCFNCGDENWAMAVSTGFCAFCGHDANAPEPIVNMDDDRESGAV